jgi:Photosynthetic reaction centre cytochrome C subunit
MGHQSVRIFLSIWGLIAIGMLLAEAQSPPIASQAAANQTTEQRFKNIQVLKGIPGDQLIPAMQFITASLGVECSFCHVENHFDQDDKKPKQMARKMMQMMAAINQQNFDNHREVTCNTCHRGSSRPVSIPIISEEPRPRTVPPILDAEDNYHPTCLHQINCWWVGTSLATRSLVLVPPSQNPPSRFPATGSPGCSR